MSTHFVDISAALDGKLKTFTDANSIPVAWDNAEYTPVVGTLYLRPTIQPGDSEPIGLSYTSALDHLGRYQIDIIAPIDSGKGVATTKADLLFTEFARGNLPYNGKSITIKSVSRSAGNRDSAWYVLSVIINYQSITGN